MSELVRAFLAVEVSDEARGQVTTLLDKLREHRGAAVRWVKPDVMHLTLVFLGEVPEGFIRSADERLAEVLPPVSSFSCRLAGLGAFPSPQRARVVWVGVDTGRDALISVQRAASRALERIGHQPERRSFSPHLTLGRLREPGDVSPLLGTQFVSECFPVGRVVLFRSVLKPQGPEYSVLHEYRLAAKPA
ncbi:MAG: RNA 2',3'-cyclic phosphodiesterase [bacterium]